MRLGRWWVRWTSLLGWLAGFGMAPWAQAAEVSVAVAANFAAPLKALAQAFERETSHRVVASVGSTGALYAQVVNGAPFQVLLSADDKTPARLEAEGRAVAGTRFVYATGRLALWSAKPGFVDDQGRVLAGDNQSRLALANPKLAPYGAAALEVLERLGHTARWQPRLVQGENIAQAYQFVASGNAALGFVALSQVMQEGRFTHGSGWVVPAHLHGPLKQEAVLLRAGPARAGGANGTAASLPTQGPLSGPAPEAFMAFLKGEAAKRIIVAYGYEP